MPDITQTVFSIAADDPLEDYDDPGVSEEGSGGGGHTSVTKTAKAARQDAVRNAQEKRDKETKENLLKVLDKFPKFGSEAEETKFLARYVGWVQACVEIGEVIIRDEDLEFDFFRSGGPGGQNVNKVSSGARVSHMPTNISAESTKTPNQHRNKEDAMEILLVRLERHLDDWKAFLAGDLGKLNPDFVKQFLF